MATTFPRLRHILLLGVDLDWRVYVPGAILGLLVGVYFWRAPLRLRQGKLLRREAKAHRPVRHYERWLCFTAALAWTAGVAHLFNVGTYSPFPLAFAAVLGGFFICAGLGLWWLTLWARQKNARAGQFGVGSLFFLTVFAAIFFGTVRWVVVQPSPQLSHPDSVGFFCTVALICLVGQRRLA